MFIFFFENGIISVNNINERRFFCELKAYLGYLKVTGRNSVALLPTNLNSPRTGLKSRACNALVVRSSRINVIR